MCTPGRHRPELWLWSFFTAMFRNPVQRVENHGYILVWLRAFFSSSRSLSAKEKKNPKTVNIFEALIYFSLSCKIKIEFLILSNGSSLFQDRRLTLYHWKVLFRLISNMWLCLLRNWKMTVKGFAILNTFPSIRVGCYFFYAFGSLVSLQTLSIPSFDFAKRFPEPLTFSRWRGIQGLQLTSSAGFAFTFLMTLPQLTLVFTSLHYV